MSSEIALDTVIVAYRSEGVIGTCIDAVKPLGGTVVVVDHGDGGSAAVAERHGAVAITNPANPGFGSGQNQGVRQTSTPYVLLCNPDAVASAEAIRAAVAVFASRPEVAAIQGVILNAVTGGPERSAGTELGPVHLLGRALGARHLARLAILRRVARRSATLRDHVERAPIEPHEVEALAATAVLVRRDAFDAVGGFDESYFLYGEDLDFCRRLRVAGWTLMAMPEVWAVHQSGGSARSSWARELTWWGGTMTFAARRWSTRRWRLGLVAAVTRAVVLIVCHPMRPRATWRAVVSAPRAARTGGVI